MKNTKCKNDPHPELGHELIEDSNSYKCDICENWWPKEYYIIHKPKCKKLDYRYR